MYIYETELQKKSIKSGGFNSLISKETTLIPALTLLRNYIQYEPKVAGQEMSSGVS